MLNKNRLQEMIVKYYKPVTEKRRGNFKHNIIS